MEDNSSTASQKIAAQNDEFRKTGKGGRVMLTAGINALGHSAANSIINLVRTFNDFNANNDPYAEHDFGSFMDGGLKVFWKIECYDRGLQFASPDPTNPDVARSNEMPGFDTHKRTNGERGSFLGCRKTDGFRTATQWCGRHRKTRQFMCGKPCRNDGVCGNQQEYVYRHSPIG